jgi:hypothetical protein
MTRGVPVASGTIRADAASRGTIAIGTLRT